MVSTVFVYHFFVFSISISKNLFGCSSLCENGFGYDPIFYYPPFGKTTAELAPEEKNAVSHRGNALRVFYDKMKEAGYADQ